MKEVKDFLESRPKMKEVTIPLVRVKSIHVIEEDCLMETQKSRVKETLVPFSEFEDESVKCYLSLLVALGETFDGAKRVMKQNQHYLDYLEYQQNLKKLEEIAEGTSLIPKIFQDQDALIYSQRIEKYEKQYPENIMLPTPKSDPKNRYPTIKQINT